MRLKFHETKNEKKRMKFHETKNEKKKDEETILKFAN